MRNFFLILWMLVVGNLAFAGGIVTNTNQSASWARMLVRDASTDIDAVFSNPAGLTKLPDGFHLYLSNQTIVQNMSIENSALNKKYEGKVFAPVFPNFYAAYKTGKFAFSFGFTPVGGGGSASYDKGVPMMYLPVAKAAESLKQLGVKGYSLDANFDGSSVYFGLQLGVSYAINDMISVYGGARYVWVNNKFEGKMENISFDLGGSSVPANKFINNVASGLKGIPAGTKKLVDGGLGANTLTDAVNAGYLEAKEKMAIEKVVTAAGQDPYAMNISQINAVVQAAAPILNKKAAELEAGAQLMGGAEADVKQTGNGITPIVGVNLSLLEEKLNVGIKYEFQTNMELTNETPKGKGFTVGFNADGTPIEMFPDGGKTNADMPALLSVGVSYKVIDDLKVHVGYHNYFDKATGWAKRTIDGKEVDVVDKNLWELGLGVEYQLTESLLLSAGFLRGVTGANDKFHRDSQYSLTSDTYGLGGKYKINDMISLEAGVFYVNYENKAVTTADYTQTYYKDNIAASVGVALSFGN